MPEHIFQKIAARIDRYRDHAVDIQTALTAIPALGPENGGEGEEKKAVYIDRLLQELDFDTREIIKAPDSRVPCGYRPSVLAMCKGSSDKRTIWIMSHIDIVPPGDLSLWDTDPYTVTEKDGRLYGRGTEDDQQGFVSSYLAVKALQDEGVIPGYNVGLAVVADEENGSKYGIQYVLKHRSSLFRPDDLIIVPDAGDSRGIEIEVAEKSILWVKFTVTGKMTHGSTPERGINAHKAGAHLIVRLNELYSRFAAREELYDPPVSTFEPTQKTVNVENINTIPGQDVFYFDCRILPSYNLADVKESMKEYCTAIETEFGVTVEMTYPQEEAAPPPTPADTPAAEAIKKAVKEVTGRDAFTLGIGGGTVAAYFRHAGLPAVCWCTLDDTLHAPNEYCVIDNMLNDAKVFAHIMLQEEL